MTTFVVLTEHEIRMCAWVGKQRYAYAVKNMKDPGEGPSRQRKGPEFDIRGACCEFAASIMLNLYWRPSIGSTDQKDVGGLVEVRSTIIPTGRLIIKPGASGPYVLVFQRSEETYQSLGWINAEEAFTVSTLDATHGDPAHYIRQGLLHDLETLLVG